MAYETFYQGTPYGLDPGSDVFYTGARVKAGAIGGTTSIQSANQVQEVANLFNTGMKTAEVSTISPEVFDMIPKQHMEELNRQAKLVNAELTLHAPLIEPSGFTQQGWSEQNRELAERQLKEVMLRGHALSPDRPMPVTIHSSAIPGTETMPIDMVKNLTDKERELYSKTGKVPTQMIAVNQETGEMTGLKREARYYPGREGKIYSPHEELKIVNESHWDNKLSNLVFYKERGDEIINKNLPKIQEAIKVINNAQAPEEKKYEALQDVEQAKSNLGNAEVYLQNTHMTINSLYNEAYKVADEAAKKGLMEASKRFQENLQVKGEPHAVQSKAMQYLINDMQNIMTNPHSEHTPQLYRPVEEFAVKKAGETFANVAWAAYDEYKENAPMVSIENPPYGTAISTAEDLKNLIEESRKKFAEKAIKEGMGADEAKRVAKNMIGATWDTSHISMMRKQGYDEKELIKQAETIAPVVKHIHLNDNFGFSHTDLPPGMGTVPIKEIMEKFQKEGFKGKQIFEGGGFFQHFKTNPHGLVLGALGSPVYGTSATPTWTNIYGTMGGYASGGMMFPEQHHAMYGSGFSGLPQDLGGQIPGRQSRFSGAGMD